MARNQTTRQCIKFFRRLHHEFVVNGKRTVKTSSWMVRLDEESKSLVASVAELRQISVSDDVRWIVPGQAKRELAAVESQTIAMAAADEQLQSTFVFFWTVR